MLTATYKHSRLTGLGQLITVFVIIFIGYKAGVAIASDNTTKLFLLAGVLIYAWCVYMKWEITVFLFIVIFPTFQQIAPFEIGFMDLNKFLTVGLIASYLVNYGFTFEKIKKKKRMALFLFIFWYLIYQQYRHLKGINFGYEVCDRLYFVQLIVWFVNCIAVFLVISKSDVPRVRNAIKYGLAIGTLVLLISVYFSEYFAGLGLVPHVEISHSDEFGFRVIRYAGLYNGHTTMFSALMATMFGYFISVIQQTGSIKNKLIYFILCALVLGTFIFNPSRNGMAGIVCIFIVFMVFERSGYIILSFGMIIGFSILVQIYGDVFLFRMNPERVVIQLQESRIMLLKLYVADLLSHPEYLFYGTTAPLPVNTHNTYLEIIYNGGIPFFSVFCYIIYKTYRYRKVAQFNIIYPMLGFLIPFAGNNNPLELYYVMIITLAFSGISNEKEIQTAKESTTPRRITPVWGNGKTGC